MIKPKDMSLEEYKLRLRISLERNKIASIETVFGHLMILQPERVEDIKRHIQGQKEIAAYKINLLERKLQEIANAKIQETYQ